MANIAISDLRPAGSELFFDSEGYMNNLDDSEVDIVNGGCYTPAFPLCARSSIRCVKVSAAVTKAGIKYVTKRLD
ncbi:hypothetical protein H6F74_27350 [Trichocoleus sp. FACHB-90]|uniref:hypothetical protein n=1 Tax=Cyanophyceae TaxID=3028117 RepID=UPI0016842339|nr:hypothetical protein [Trichocoleus sp. FACHB-90]MBD1929920.1 hypothetical protein [Trichocoleus sp. FACHB-90]